MPDLSSIEATADAGLLVLVVGPSGAGKDTLIDGARQALAGQPFLFARRIVTRPSSQTEQHDSLDPDGFARATEAGAFAFQWNAHGLSYGIPSSIGAALAAGETVVCNVSRGIVEELRASYGRVRVIYVDAPLEIRLARIAGRARPAERPDRGRRRQEFTPSQADIALMNDRAVSDGVEAFMAALCGPDDPARPQDPSRRDEAGKVTLPGTAIE